MGLGLRHNRHNIHLVLPSFRILAVSTVNHIDHQLRESNAYYSLSLFAMHDTCMHTRLHPINLSDIQ